VLMNARVAAIESAAQTHLMNLAHAAYSFGYAAGAIATGFARSNALPPGQILAMAAVLILLLTWITLERGPSVNGFARRATGSPGLGLVPVWGGIIVMVAFMSENAAENWSALHIERTLGGSPSQGSLGPAVLALVMGAGRILGQVVVRHSDERQLLVGGALVAAAGLALTGLAPAPWLAYTGLCIMGVGGSVIAPTAYAIVGRSVPDEARAHALARATLLGYMGYFFGPPALGLISELFGLRLAFVAMAGVLLVAQGVIALMFWHIRQR
jgi:predicted MFS family arabinose efflux permease